MKLLHAIHDYLPAHRSGSEIYAHALAGALRARGHEVEIVCAETDLSQPSGTVRRRELDGLPVTELVNNWSVTSFAESYRPKALAAPLGELLRRFRPDVVHVHNLLNLSFDLPAMARREGAAVVATLHDFTLFCASGGQRLHLAERHVCREIDVERCARCFRQSHFYHLMKAAAPPSWWRSILGPRRGAHGEAPRVSERDVAARLGQVRGVVENIELLVSPSQALAAEVARLGIPESKLEVSGNGHEPLEIEPRPATAGPLRVGYVGTVAWHKGVHVLIEALRRLSPGSFEASIHGALDWYPDYVAELRAAARGLPVTFAGSFGPGDVAKVYAGIDLLVVPSLWMENSPLVVHEAFQAGIPVVVARNGGLPELVADGVNGLVCAPGSAEELAGALAGLAADRGRLARLAAAVPKVKSTAADAADWEARYLRVLERRRA